MTKKQKVIPETSTSEFDGMSFEQIRYWCKEYYGKFIGTTVRNDNTGITIRFKRRGRKKTAFGSGISKRKAAVVKILDEVLRCAVSTNWGDRKTTDPEDVIGYLNFKCKILIDGKISYFLLNVQLCSVDKNRYCFHYSLDECRFGFTTQKANQ